MIVLAFALTVSCDFCIACEQSLHAAILIDLRRMLLQIEHFIVHELITVIPSLRRSLPRTQKIGTYSALPELETDIL